MHFNHGSCLEDWKSRRCSPFYYLLVFIVLCCSARSEGIQLDPFYWNSSNPIFWRDSDTMGLSVRIMDSLTIFCPRSERLYRNYEYSMVYMVNRSSAEACVVPPESPIIGVCQRPELNESMTIVFRSMSPIPSRFPREFQPGNSYYFISTSSGTSEGIKNREGGLCRLKNMRLHIRVLPRLNQKIVDNSPSLLTGGLEGDRKGSEYASSYKSGNNDPEPNFYSLGLGSQTNPPPAPFATKRSEEVVVQSYIIHEYGEEENSISVWFEKNGASKSYNSVAGLLFIVLLWLIR